MPPEPDQQDPHAPQDEQPEEHYFSASPASPDARRPLRVRLEGRDLELTTAPSVFSGDRLDTGTAVLLDQVPDPPADGDLLDLGCGWGPLALAMALRSPEPAARRVWAVDVNERARELTALNAAALGLGGVRAVAPDDVPDGVRIGALWSNPPIRIGKPALHALLLRWLPRLDAGARAHLVVAKDLGADSLLRWLGEQGCEQGWSARRTGSRKGYRVLEVSR